MPAKRDGAFQKAIQTYIQELSDDDREAFLSASDVMECLEDSEGKSLISASLWTRVEKVLQCVKHFMGSLGIFIQHSPEISSLVVGGVNCILTVYITSSDFLFMETCVNILLLNSFFWDTLSSLSVSPE